MKFEVKYHNMKKQILIVFFLSFLLPVNAQDFLTEFLAGKPDNSNNLTVSISGRMLRLAAAADSKADKDFREFAENVDRIRIVTLNEINSNDKKRIKKLLESFEELMTVEQSEQNISMFTKENKGKITEFILLVDMGDVQMITDIVGNIDLKQLAKLSKSLKIDGLEQLEKIDKKNKK